MKKRKATIEKKPTIIISGRFNKASIVKAEKKREKKKKLTIETIIYCLD